jgi:hypothetical protein
MGIDEQQFVYQQSFEPSLANHVAKLPYIPTSARLVRVLCFQERLWYLTHLIPALSQPSLSSQSTVSTVGTKRSLDGDVKMEPELASNDNSSLSKQICNELAELISGADSEENVSFLMLFF